VQPEIAKSAPSARAQIERLPESIAGYRVDGVLGRGGSGIVLRVWDEALERPLALKLLTDGFEEEARKRFMVEAKAAGRIVHPNVVQVYAVGVHEERAYIIQELVEGHPLSSLLEVRGRLSAGAVIDIGVQAAKGLARAAEVGVLHRDVKPQNLLVTDAGLVKLADFGLAKLLHAPSALTDTGTTLGTPHYMSPEQGLAQDLDARSDQYSLGATLYHLLTGRAPFDSDNALALLLKHVQEPLVPVRDLEPTSPPALALAIERMLMKNRDERFPTFDAVVEALESIDVDAPAEGESPPLVSLAASAPKIEPVMPVVSEHERGHRSRLRDRVLVAIAGGAAIAVVMVALLSGNRRDRTPPQPPVAQSAEIVPAPQPREPEPKAVAPAHQEEEKPATPPKKRELSRLESLLEELNDPSAAEGAIKSLGALGDQTATMPLVHVLESAPSTRQRVAAAEALGRLGDARALQSLRRAADHAISDSVRRAAKDAADRLFAVEEDPD
jgi:serine/threonine-protein kinase